MTPVLIMLATGYSAVAAVIFIINLVALIADNSNTPRQEVIMFFLICLASVLWPLAIVTWK